MMTAKKIYNIIIKIIILLLSSLDTVQAIYIKDEPSVVVSIMGTNHLKRGENVITLVAYNPAKERWIIYNDENQALFFKGKEHLLFTAYNVSFELEGNEFIEVKTPVQMIPILKPMQPVQLKFVVKVKNDTKAGTYELKLKVSYDTIRWADIDFDIIRHRIPTLYNISGNYSQYGEVTRYEVTQYIKKLYLAYDHKEVEIPLQFYVEKEDVKLKIVNVRAEHFQAKGKGLLTIEVKNVGEKVGRNAYLVLDVPTGFHVKTKLNTNSMYVGDLIPNKTIEVTFPVKINVKDPGNYTFKLKAVYLDEYGNTRRSKPVQFGVYVEPPPNFKISNIVSEVYVNSKGTVKVILTSDKPVKEATAILTVKPPLHVLSSECYLGDLNPNQTKIAVFKIKASKDAEAITYPADLKIKYKVLNEWVTSDPIKIGIKVNPTVKFEIIGCPEIMQGEEKIVTVKIRNLGNFTVRDATARIMIVDPFTSTDDSAYIGTLKPGETKEISFKIKAKSDATPKEYGLDVEVKYKNMEGEWSISEPTKMVIKVIPSKPPILQFIVPGLIAVVIVAYLLRRY